MIRLKRIYAPAEAVDGTRVLVDRLWPRGMTKDAAAVDLWLKEVAPSTELRRWFGHDAARWAEFERRYRDELAEPARAAAFAQLRRIADEAETLTLLFSTREENRNHATVLATLLRRPL